MEKTQIKRLHTNFEDCAHEKNGTEFWYARELQELLGYDEWRNFEGVVDKAKIACQNAGQRMEDHFVGVNKTIPMPKGAYKKWYSTGSPAAGGRHQETGTPDKIRRQEITENGEEVKVMSTTISSP